MEQRISLVTLGVSDLARSRTFYEALGWRGQEVEETVFFQAGGLALGLLGRDKLAQECGLVDGTQAGFGGIALSHNVRSDAEVDDLLAAAELAGGTISKPAATNAVGFYSGAFVDPSGHAIDIDRSASRHLHGDESAPLIAVRSNRVQVPPGIDGTTSLGFIG